MQKTTSKNKKKLAPKGRQMEPQWLPKSMKIHQQINVQKRSKITSENHRFVNFQSLKKLRFLVVRQLF